MPDRPAPVVTVSVPGRPGRPDLLDAEPPPRLPATRAQRTLTAAASVVLLTGLVVAAVGRAETPPVRPDPPPPTVVAQQTDAGVSAVATDAGLTDDPFVLQLLLTVDVDVAGSGGPGDSQSPSGQDDVTLLGLTGQGFVLRLEGVEGPAALGPAGREGKTFAFDVEVAVTDCSVPTQAQRRLDLALRRGDGPQVSVRVATASDVVRRLDRLVATTCRRPRG